MLPTELANKKIILVKEDPFFISPQGEGKYMGRLSAWMRTSTCNLRCAWDNGDGTVTLCDTAYSSHIPSRNIVTMQQAYDYLVNNNCPHVVLTGGEPTNQNTVQMLVDYLEDAGKRVTIETNGTSFFPSKATLISMSPKLSTSSSGLKVLSEKPYTADTDAFLDEHYGKVEWDGDPSGALSTFWREKEALLAKNYKRNFDLHEAARYNLESFKLYMDYYGPERYQFKFVVNQESDIAEIIQFYQKPLNIPADNIWLMPQGLMANQIQKRAGWVVEQCKKYGFNYSDRIHVRIWDNMVGV